MKTWKKLLALVASAAILHSTCLTTGFAAPTTWQTTGSGNSQDWFTAGNWSAGTPGNGDTALISTNKPPSGVILINSNTGVGAIVDTMDPSNSLALNGTANLTLYGQTVTVPEVGVANYTQANTVLAFNTSLSTRSNMTLASTLNLILNGAQNNILSSSGSGSAAGQTITINGNISNGPGASALTFLGGGTPSASGATLVLNGTNTFTGGLTIGNNAGTQGGAVSVTAAKNLPSTGTITVNEQGQLLLAAAGTYGAVGQLLVLNGIGINKNSSGTVRTGGNATDTMIWQGDVQINSSLPINANDGYVVFSVTSAATKTIQLTGKLTGAGSLQKQGQGTLLISGTNNDITGGNQVGNGVLTVDFGSRMGTGDFQLFQTSSNTATLNLFNAAQTITSLSSQHTLTSGGSATVGAQAINLGGNPAPGHSGDPAAVLTINQAKDATFGYGAVSTLTSTIQGPGSIIMGAAATKTLTFTGPNTYTGGTTLNGGILSVANAASGSATGTGNVTVNNGGKFASGNATVFGSPVTSGTISGSLVVNNGGIIIPGHENKIGTLNIGTAATPNGIIAHNGAVFNFDLLGGTTAQADKIVAQGSVTLDNGGIETVNILGSKLAFGSYTLMNFASLANAGTSFTLGATPGGTGRVYQLVTNPTSLVLNIQNTANERYWSVGGGANTPDGAGTWAVSGTNFYNINPNLTQAAYDNTANTAVIVGNGGAGGLITLGSPNVRVGGNLILGAATTPYTLGAVAGTNTLTTAAGITASASATINAPVILEASQTFSTDTGVTLTLNGGIAGTGTALTKDGGGTVILTGAGTYTGGTVINQGTLQGNTASIPSTGGVINNGALVFNQSASDSFTGAISGAGSVTINNTGASTSLTLTNPANSYSGATIIQSGILSVSNVANLGSGAGGIILSGGTLRATQSITFPFNGGSGPGRTLTLTAGTTSTIDVPNAADSVIFAQNLGGAGNITKTGAGTVTFTGLPSTTIIGQVAVSGGALVFAPPALIPSFGISASTTPNTFAGDLVLGNPMELRLFGGSFTGTGSLRVKVSNTTIVSRDPSTVLGMNVILNDNVTPIPGFTAQLGANAGSNGPNTLAINGIISGASDVTFNGSGGNTVLGNVSTYTGSTTIDPTAGGEVILGVNNALPATTSVHLSSTGILNLNGKNQTIASIDSGNGNATSTPLIINEASTPSILTINDTTPVANGPVSKTFGGLLVDGQLSTLGLTLAATNTSSLSLTNANLISGPLDIAGGRLDVQNLAGLGSPSLITVGATAGNSQLRFHTLVGTFTFGNTNNHNAPASPITLAGLGGYNTGSSTDQGAIRVDAASDLTLPSNITFAADSSIVVTTASALTLTGHLTGNGALIKQGNGLLTLAGTNPAFTGGTRISAGTLTVNSNSNLGTGPLQVDNPNTGPGTTGVDVVLNLNNAAQTVGSLSGTTSIPETGVNTTTINLASNHTLTVNQTTDGTFDGVIAGDTGKLTKSGPATLTITGIQTYKGSTTVTGGTLDASGGSILASTAPMSVTGNGSVLIAKKIAPTSLTLGTGATAKIAGGDASAIVSVIGALNLAGTPATPTATLDLTDHDLILKTGVITDVRSLLKKGYGAGNWDGGVGILSSAAPLASMKMGIGYFQNGNPGAPLQTTFDTQSNLTGGELLLKYTLIGDSDFDGKVGFSDLVAVAQNYDTNNGTAVWNMGDFNYDGNVDFQDLVVLAQGYDSTLPWALPGAAVNFQTDLAAAFASVPEPSGAMLATLALCALIARRRGRPRGAVA